VDLDKNSVKVAIQITLEFRSIMIEAAAARVFARPSFRENLEARLAVTTDQLPGIMRLRALVF
jgi:hypothetical protein